MPNTKKVTKGLMDENSSGTLYSSVLHLPGNLEFDITEELLLIYQDRKSSTVKINEDDSLFLISRVSKFLSSLESFYFDLEHLPEIENERLREFLIANLHKHILHDYVAISIQSDYPAVKEALLNILFEAIPGDERFTSNKAIMVAVSKTQASLIINLYKEDMDASGELILNICQYSPSRELIYDLIEQLSSFIIDKPSVIAYDFPAIIQHMALDGSQNCLLQVVINGVKDCEIRSIEALSSLMMWVDINLLNSIDCLNMINSLLQEENKFVKKAAFMCLKSFFTRENEPADLKQLAIDFKLIDQCLSFVSLEESDDKDLLIISQLLNVMYDALPNDGDLVPGFFKIGGTLSVMICLNTWNEIQKEIFVFLNKFLVDHPENAEEVVEIGLKNCKSICEIVPQDYDILFTNALKLIQIGLKVIPDEPRTVINIIQPLLQQIHDKNDTQQAAVALSGISNFNFVTDDDRVFLCELFQPLLTIDNEEELKTLAHAIAVNSFITIATKFYYQIGDEGIEPSRQAFMALISILHINSSWDTEYGEKAVKTLQRLLRANIEPIVSILVETEKIQQVVSELLSVGKSPYNELLSTIFNSLPIEIKGDIITIIMTKLSEFLESTIPDIKNERSEFNDYVNNMEQSLDFIRNLNYNGLPETVRDGLMFDYFNKAFQICLVLINDGHRQDVLSSYILSSTKVLGPVAFPLFLEYLAENPTGSNENFAAIAEAGCSLNPESEEDSRYISMILDLIMPFYLRDQFDFDKKSSSISIDTSSSSKEFLTYTSLFLVPLFDSFIPDDVKEQVFLNIIKSVSQLIQPEHILVPILEFLTANVENALTPLMTSYKSFQAIFSNDSGFYFPGESIMHPLFCFITLHRLLISHDNNYVTKIEDDLQSAQAIVKNKYMQLIKMPDSEIQPHVEELASIIQSEPEQN